MIKWLFCVKLLLSLIMLTFGPNWPLLLCFYIARYVPLSKSSEINERNTVMALQNLANRLQGRITVLACGNSRFS